MDLNEPAIGVNLCVQGVNGTAKRLTEWCELNDKVTFRKQLASEFIITKK
jgi:hypothetical protein